MELETAAIDHDAPIRISEGDEGLAVELYRRMALVREFEQRANRLFLQGQLPGTIHLSLGQEACAVGATATLAPDDWATITHRGHGQALGKGVSARSVMAELFARDTGCCRGYGGSLHVGDIAVGAVPGIAIVGAAVPIAAGIAYAFAYAGTSRVALCFLGDGAIGEGDTHEGLNLAALWRVPVVYVCENNLYSVSTHQTRQMRFKIADWAAAYGLPARAVDGNDAMAVHAAVDGAVRNARAGEGPSFIECRTYRQGGHKRDDPGTYRDAAEVALWLGRDPLDRMRAALEAVGCGDRAARVEQDAVAAIDDAVEFAIASPVARWRP